MTLVTGAGSGIGRATAVLLGQAGHRLALVGRRREPLEQTAAMCGADSLVLPADVGDSAAAGGIVEATLARFGRLDNLVNNAGYAPCLPVNRHTPDLLERVYRVNALGPAVSIARAWPEFVRQRKGCIVNVSTMGTIDPFPGFFGYAASKAAVNLMARSCALEGREYGIRAFAVAPGAVDTDMLESLFPHVPRERRLPPEAVARVILECIRGDRDAQVGQTIVLASP